MNSVGTRIEKPSAASESDSDIEPAAKRLAVDLLKCVVCIGSLEWPALKCPVCKACFCESDHARMNAGGRVYTCPNCRSPADPRPAKTQNRILGQLPAKCPVKGCTERPARSDLTAHVVKCELRHSQLHCSRCKAVMPGSEYAQHKCVASEEEQRRDRLLDEIVKLERERDRVMELGLQVVRENEARLSAERRRFDDEKRAAQLAIATQIDALKQQSSQAAEELASAKLQLERHFESLHRAAFTKLHADFRGKAECFKISRSWPSWTFRTKLFTSNPRAAGLLCDVYATLHFDRSEAGALRVEISLAKMQGTDLRFPIYVGGGCQLLNVEGSQCQPIAGRLAGESSRLELFRMSEPVFVQDEEFYVLWLLLAPRIF